MRVGSLGCLVFSRWSLKLELFLIFFLGENFVGMMTPAVFSVFVGYEIGLAVGKALAFQNNVDLWVRNR